ncbi:MAG TPA: hypothetical protein VGJ84_07690 [Polyangiaceae bacterium]
METRDAETLNGLLTLSPSERKARGLDHTPREIAQQPETWLKTYQIVRDQRTELLSALEGTGVLGQAGAPRPVVLLLGAGTSDYVGGSVAPLLTKRWGCVAQSVPSTSLLTHSEDFIAAGQRYLCISFSRSGASSEGVAVLDALLERHPDIQHLIVTCNGDGPMAKNYTGSAQVTRLVLDDSVNDRGLAMTSSFSNMVVAAQCLAHLEDLDGYGELVPELSKAADRMLERAAPVCAGLSNSSQICFLGSGALYSAARESALKVLELTAGRVRTFSETFLGVRHGPLSALNARVLLVGYVSGDPVRRAYELDLLEEVREKRLVERMVAVLAVPDPRAERLSDQSIALDLDARLGDDYRPVLDVIFAQLLGLFASLRHGLQPDAPSPNGVIRRVVTGLRLHGK